MSEIRFLEVEEESPPSPTTSTDEEEVEVLDHIDDVEYQKRLNQFQKKGATLHRRSVSHIGALSLVTTTKDSLPIISGMVVIDGKVSREDAKQMVINRLINRFYRFRSVVKNMSVFEELSLEQMDMDYHLKFVSLPNSRFAATGEEAGDDDEDERLRQVLVEIDNKELDLTKPLWDSYLIENYSKGTVYYLRFHHCLGDGVSGGLILTSLNDESNNQQSPALEEARRVYQKIGMLSYFFHWLVFLIWLIAGSVVVLVRYAIDGLISEPKTIFTKRDAPNVKKEVAWSTKYSLKQIKEIQKVCKATLNDIVLSTIGGALQRYRKAHDPNYQQETVVRFGIPFNIRSIQESLNMKDLSNQFGVVMNKVELNQAQSSATRLKKMKKTMDIAKKYPEAYVTNFLLKMLHLFSPTNNIFRSIFTILSGRCTWNCSNVRGPDFELRVCGKRVTHLVGFVPAPLGIAVAFLAASYNENLALSIRADNNVIPKVTELMHCWEDEIDDLLQTATNPSSA